VFLLIAKIVGLETGPMEFVSFRENIDTGGPLGRAMVVIIGAIAELERSLIVERVRAGMRQRNWKAGGLAVLRWKLIVSKSCVTGALACRSAKWHGNTGSRVRACAGW
jgi:Resolvase, N terminal domain